MRKIAIDSLLAGALSFALLGGGVSMAQAPGGGGAGQSQPQPTRPPSEMNNPNGPNGQAAGDAGASTKVDDKKFAKDAAMGGMVEVELGKLAAQKASNDAVKQFGQKMVDDHSKANDELKQVASSESLTLPDSLDSKHQAMVDKMSKLSGPAFDKAYVKDMVKDHEKDVSDFQKEAQNGTDPNVKQFAAKTLPVLQGHLESIKDIRKQEASSK